MYLSSAAAEKMGLQVWEQLDDGDYLIEEALMKFCRLPVHEKHTEEQFPARI